MGRISYIRLEEEDRDPALTSTATVSSTIDRATLEKQIHKLKLEWIMAKNDAERVRASQEIRKLTGPRKAS